jgi:glycerophosphoryl diester phosphodiesterase
MNSFLKIAHRGYSELFPENTMPAFEKAIEAGADMMEFDVHMSKDGHAVVIHDNDVRRTSEGYGLVKDLTLAELRALDFNFTGDREIGRAIIPTLQEVLLLSKGKIALNIEIKNCPYRYPGIEEEVSRLVRTYDMAGDVVISSFDHFSLVKIKKIDPVLKTGMLYDALWLSFRDEVTALEVYSVHPSIDVVETGQLEWARKLGIRVYPWVAKDRDTIAALRASGLVDGVMVNDLSLFDSGTGNRYGNNNRENRR